MYKRILILLLAAGASPLRADSLSYTVTPSGAQFLYDFTLTNTGDTGGTLFDLFVHIPIDISDIDTTMIGTPAGWGDGTGGLLFFGSDNPAGTSFIDWASDFSGLYDVQIGSSLSSFSFLSSVDIDQPIMFAPNGSPNLSTATPEPSMSILMFLGMAAVAALQCRSKICTAMAPGRLRQRGAA